MAEEISLLASKVQRWREYMDLTPNQASVVCCVNQVKYQKFETGIVVPPPTKLKRMSIFAHIDPAYFEEDVSLQEFELKLREQIEQDDYKYKGWLKTSPAKLSEKLTIIRNIHHLTQRQIALIANCTIYAYTYLEKGKGRSLPIGDTSVVACIANFFDIPLSDFLDNEIDPLEFRSKYLDRIEYQENKR